MSDRSSSPKAVAFDPYSAWLGIPSDRRPPSYYDLFGLPAFEANAAKIEQAALRRMGKVRQQQLGTHSDISQEILDELARARLVLMDPHRRAEYDARLRGSAPPPTLPATASARAAWIPEPAPAPLAAPAPPADTPTAFPSIVTGEEGKLKVSPRRKRAASRAAVAENGDGEEVFSLRTKDLDRPSKWWSVGFALIPVAVLGFVFFRHRIPGLDRPSAAVAVQPEPPRPIPPPDTPRIAPPQAVPDRPVPAAQVETPAPDPVAVAAMTPMPKPAAPKTAQAETPKPTPSADEPAETPEPRASATPEVPASKILAGKGLKRTGQFLLLESEGTVREKYAEVSGLYQQCATAISRCVAMDQQVAAVADMVAGRATLVNTINAGTAQMNAMPRRNALERASYQQMAAQRGTLTTQLQMVDQQIQALRSAQPTPQVMKDAYGEAEKARTAVREGVIELRKAADSVKDEYELLGRDPEVKAALASLHTRPETARVKLGPSDKFQDLVKKIRSVEKEVGAQKAAPSSSSKATRKKAK